MILALLAAVVITLTWTDTSDNETSFYVYRCIAPPGACTSMEFIQIVQLVRDSQTWKDTTAPDGQHICYRVTAGNEAGESEPSNDSCLVTPVATPSGPTNLTVSVEP